MKNLFNMIPGQRPPNQPETEGRLPRLLPSELSGTDFRYSVSPLWATRIFPARRAILFLKP